ncbi:hypothetical protein K505DRAFT_381822 [Melanomma pulvis-pyrius CBS 109.77]|uniref:Uncharacterized protein n=1 Tax=Melanomma pulvis-pyrius CBS 109.77 TaxID=1314802 RepID=A0A6A6XH24_9PLEO|nr:hypothetical protein K505DRAFT_381822 [Melanomma pulvis-pyrius CBS 109.77]
MSRRRRPAYARPPSPWPSPLQLEAAGTARGHAALLHRATRRAARTEDHEVLLSAAVRHIGRDRVEGEPEDCRRGGAFQAPLSAASSCRRPGRGGVARTQTRAAATTAATAAITTKRDRKPPPPMYGSDPTRLGPDCDVRNSKHQAHRAGALCFLPQKGMLETTARRDHTGAQGHLGAAQQRTNR